MVKVEDRRHQDCSPLWGKQKEVGVRVAGRVLSTIHHLSGGLILKKDTKYDEMLIFVDLRVWVHESLLC